MGHWGSMMLTDDREGSSIVVTFREWGTKAPGPRSFGVGPSEHKCIACHYTTHFLENDSFVINMKDYYISTTQCSTARNGLSPQAPEHTHITWFGQKVVHVSLQLSHFSMVFSMVCIIVSDWPGRIDRAPLTGKK